MHRTTRFAVVLAEAELTVYEVYLVVRWGFQPLVRHEDG